MGENEDRALYDLAPILKCKNFFLYKISLNYIIKIKKSIEIVKKKVPDVRIALRRFRDIMIENI
jgi:hypothetical protein